MILGNGRRRRFLVSNRSREVSSTVLRSLEPAPCRPGTQTLDQSPECVRQVLGHIEQRPESLTGPGVLRPSFRKKPISWDLSESVPVCRLNRSWQYRERLPHTIIDPRTPSSLVLLLQLRLTLRRTRICRYPHNPRGYERLDPAIEAFALREFEFEAQSRFGQIYGAPALDDLAGHQGDGPEQT